MQRAKEGQRQSYQLTFLVQLEVELLLQCHHDLHLQPRPQ